MRNFAHHFYADLLAREIERTFEGRRMRIESVRGRGNEEGCVEMFYANYECSRVQRWKMMKLLSSIVRQDWFPFTHQHGLFFCFIVFNLLYYKSRIMKSADRRVKVYRATWKSDFDRTHNVWRRKLRAIEVSFEGTTRLVARFLFSIVARSTLVLHETR